MGEERVAAEVVVKVEAVMGAAVAAVRVVAAAEAVGEGGAAMVREVEQEMVE